MGVLQSTQWRHLRAAAARTLPARCPYCGRLVRADEPWDLSHTVAHTLGGAALDPANLAPAHRRCNRAEASSIGWQVKKRKRARTLPPSRDWSGPAHSPRSPEVAEPSRIW